jgi:RimJ/RimL family protein N-acetyltransferase
MTPVDHVFRTERLDVRPWTHDDVATMYDIYRRWEVARWLGAAPKVAESADAMHATVDRWAAAEDPPYGIWAVVPHVLARPVGTVLLVPLKGGDGAPTGDVEVGWHLHPEHWGNGYATEAASGALARAWAAGLTEVFAVVYPGNDPSVAVTQRLGMTPRGRTSRWYGVELESFAASRPDDYQGP